MMLFEELMMDSNTLMKFKIYKKIYNLKQTTLSIAQLAAAFDLNYQQALIILAEINQEITDYSKRQPSILKKAGKINTASLIVSIDEYRYLLLKKSIPFMFILYFLNHEQPTIKDFCSRHYVSQSTVSRKMGPLKKHVKRFNLRFSYREANLIGDERIVRVALFNTLWLGTRGTVWPFKNVKKSEAVALVQSFSEYFPSSRTYLGAQELSYFAAIFLSRIRKKLFVTYDPKYDFLMKDNPYYDFERLNKVLGPVKALPPEKHKAESSFIFFLAHYAPFYTLESDPALQQTLTDFLRRENSIQRFVDTFITYMQKEVFYEAPELLDQSLLKGNLFNVFFVFHVLQQPFPSLQGLITQPEKSQQQMEILLEQKMRQFLIQHLNHDTFPYLPKIQANLIQSLKNVLLPYLDQIKHSDNLKIGVAFEHEFLLVRNLYQFLNRLGFVDAYPYIDELTTDYDLVISSSLLPLKTYPDLPLYFMDLSYGDEELAYLYVRLNKLFREKNAASGY
ncbi:helix-turn-helix domain-containing protein [Enterococcus larvae]|nr:helix-turn-helix domain-containing protein [Enterococcus larvae]